MRLPLTGVKVLTIEQYGAAPYASMFMADFGADVIKIENPNSGGDFARSTGPFFLGEADSLYFQSFNLNKRSLTLDLKAPEGREVLEKLVKQSDAIINNLRGNQPSKLRVDYAGLKDINPGIVCGHISAYGRDNSRASWPGFDYLAQGEAGFLSMTGDPDSAPARFGLSIVDFMSGMMLAYAVTAAVLDVRGGGDGRDVDVSLLDAALHQLTYPGIWYLNEGLKTERQPRSAHPSVTPSQLQKTKDGWIFIMCQNPAFFDALCDAIEHPELKSDPRYATMEARLENRAQLTEDLDAIFQTKTTDEWLPIVQGKFPAGPVNDIGQALDNPFHEETGMVQTVPHPDRPDMRTQTNPVKLDGQRLPSKPGPKLGGNTDEILSSLGLDDAAIKALRDAKVI